MTLIAQRILAMQTPLRERGAGFFFWLSLLYLVLLLLGGLGRGLGWLRLDEITDPIGGVLPLGVPWFGALGAVTISLYGVFDHNHEWQPRWNYWHVARPAMGIVLATVAYFIFIGLINSTGASAPTSTAQVTTTTTTTSAPATAPSPGNASSSPTSTTAAKSGTGIAGTDPATKLIPYYVLAFIVGFREQTFRTLIQKATDMLFGPGIPGDTPPAGVGISPSPVDFGSVTVNHPQDVQVTVTNVGSGNLFMHAADVDPPGARLADPAGSFSLRDDAITGAVIAPHTTASVKVRFAPTAAGSFTTMLELASNAGSHKVNVIGQATVGQ
jgi:hypothetical protein